MATAIGIVPHTGWAWLVGVSGSPSTARVEWRTKLVVRGVRDGQLYHLAAERTADRAGFVERQRAEAVAQASRALEPHLGGARAAVVLGKRFTLPPLEKILAAHPLLHSAEGELWRAIFAEACVAGGVTVTRASAEEVRAAVEMRYGEAAVAAFLGTGKREVGSPWSREPQDAALAAWSVA